MKTKPTDIDIHNEIEELERAKGYAPNFNYFGENNFNVINAQIEELANRTSSETLELAAGDGECMSREGEAALEVAYWLEGAEDYDAPADGWAHFRLEKEAAKYASKN